MSNQLLKTNGTFLRTDTRALVGSILLGIVFVIACQVTGLIDNLLPTGKAGMYLINGTVWASFTALIVLIYKQPAGIIAGEVEALISIWYSPLWIAFIFANAIGSLAVSIVAARCSMEKWRHHILAMFLCNFLGNAVVAAGLMNIFGLPLNVAAVESLITFAVCWPASTIITKLAYDSLKKSGLV